MKDYYTVHLEKRIAILEAENEKLRLESSKYLANWIAAQDLASIRQVKMLLNIPEVSDASTTNSER